MGDHTVGEAETPATSARRAIRWKDWLMSPAVRTLAVLVPTAAGFAILQVDKGGDSSFTNSPEFGLWSAVVAVAVAVWVTMSLGLLDTVRELGGLFRDDRPAIPIAGLFGIYALYAAALFTALTAGGGGGGGPKLPLDHAVVRTRTILAIGLVSAAPIVVTLWLAGERLRRLGPLLAAAGPLSDAGKHVEELRKLWRCSVRSLAAASVAVSLAVVAAGALRNALLAYDRVTFEKLFPASALLAYGAFFTGAFAAVYMPTLLRWRGRAQQLVDAVYPTPDDGKPDETWAKGRARLEELLGINISVMAQLAGMLAIFGPLATSFLAGFVPQLANGQ